MSGLKQATCWRAMRARFRRRISSSLLPENMGPVMTSMRPTSARPGFAGVMVRMPFADLEIEGETAVVPRDRDSLGGTTGLVACESSYAQPCRGFRVLIGRSAF